MCGDGRSRLAVFRPHSSSRPWTRVPTLRGSDDCSYWARMTRVELTCALAAEALLEQFGAIRPECPPTTGGVHDSTDEPRAGEDWDFPELQRDLRGLGVTVPGKWPIG